MDPVSGMLTVMCVILVQNILLKWFLILNSFSMILFLYFQPNDSAIILTNVLPFFAMKMPQNIDYKGWKNLVYFKQIFHIPVLQIFVSAILQIWG